MDSKYHFELWNPTGLLLADLTGRADSRTVTLSRNEADDIRWTLDLNDFESYCRAINVDPKTLLITGQTEVRVRRRGKYMSGGQIVYTNTSLEADHESIEVRASGFLNLFKDRYTGSTTAGTVQETFTGVQATTIAQTLITQSQALTNGDFGITIGPNQATVGTHDRSYQRTNLKNALQDLTTVQTAPFDFEFTYDKQFNTYSQIGSQRPDIVFEYPGNIKRLGVPNDATGIANEVTALGSGFGTQAGVVVTASDTGSQGNYKLRQKVVLTSATDNSDNGVTDAANSELAAWSFPFEIPSVVVDGNMAPAVTDYGIGDFVRIRVRNHAFVNHLDAMFRVEKIALNIDSEDNEQVTLYVSR